MPCRRPRAADRAAAAARPRSLALLRQLCTDAAADVRVGGHAVALERVAELQNEQQERSVRF